MLAPTSSVPTLAERVCRPQRLGIFGHRGVGKTTLLTMLYREAVAGRLQGCRLAAADPQTAAYLSDKILQLETGQPLPATLAETELRLNLYHGQSRIELVIKDYQGEHIELGRDAPIHAFLRDCDAVWLCFDAPTVTQSPSLLRRQQEVEQLVESYLAAEPSLKMHRPFALLLTKTDLLDNAPTGTEIVHEEAPPVQHGGAPGAFDEHLAMTRHALETHCPNRDLFAVSSLSRASGEGDDPALCLQPTGLDAPLTSLVTALQTQDEARLEELFTLAPQQVKLLRQCLDSFARRYPDAPAIERYRHRLRELSRLRLRRQGVLGVAAAACLFIGLWTYDALGYHKALRYEAVHDDDPALALKQWESYQDWHPTRHLLSAKAERAEKQRLKELEKEARRLATTRHLEELRRLGDNPQADPEALWERFQAFRNDYPEASKADWEPLQNLVQQRRDELKARKATLAFEGLVTAEQRGAELTVLLAQADGFLRDQPGSVHESEVRRRRAAYVQRIDVRDIESARTYSARQPFHFQTRREHYQRYLDKHAGGGSYIKEAEIALRTIDREWDKHDFRGVRDHFEQSPGDVANLVARCRSYLAAHPSGRFVTPANDLLRFSERVTTTGEYRVVLRAGHFEKKIARFFSRGPDLSVELEVAGIRYGPSTITVNKYDPEWNFEYPRPIRWKLGDAVRIRVIDHDWKDRVVVDIASDDNDPLALRLLAGEVYSGNNTITFESEFALPVLPAIE